MSDGWLVRELDRRGDETSKEVAHESNHIRPPILPLQVHHPVSVTNELQQTPLLIRAEPHLGSVVALRFVDHSGFERHEWFLQQVSGDFHSPK